MEFAALVHEAKEGGYWAEVPALPGCATQGDTLKELLHNLIEAIEAAWTDRGAVRRNRILLLPFSSVST